MGCLFIIMMWIGIALYFSYPEIPKPLIAALVFPGAFTIFMHVFYRVYEYIDRRRYPAKWAIRDYYRALTGKDIDP